MDSIIVRAYEHTGDRELVAVVPLTLKQDAAEADIIALSKEALRSLGRFSKTEVESFRYRFDTPEPRLRSVV